MDSEVGSMSLEQRASSVDVNYKQFISFAGGYARIAITDRGSAWYWAVTAIMLVSSLVFLGLSFTKPRHQRAFHYITALITMVATVAYFSMASNIGWAPTEVEYKRFDDPEVAGVNRQVFYVRYIDWAITTPLLLMDLLLTAGLPWPIILFTITLDEIMIITGLVGSLVTSSYKWGYYVFGCIALLYIGFVLIYEARTNAYRIGRDVGKSFLICGTWTFMLWLLYPIAWAVCEGGNLIAPDSEAIFYGILDILAKPVFGALLLWGHRGIDPERLGMHIGSGNYFEDQDQADEKKRDVESSTKKVKKAVGIDRGTTNGETQADGQQQGYYRSEAPRAAPVPAAGKSGRTSGRNTGASTRSATGGGYTTPTGGQRYARNDGTGAATYSTSGPVYQTQRPSGGGGPVYSTASHGQQYAGGGTSSTGPTYTSNVGGTRGTTDATNFTTHTAAEQVSGDAGFGLREDQRSSGNYGVSSYASNMAQSAGTRSAGQEGGQNVYYTREAYPSGGNAFSSSRQQGTTIPEESGTQSGSYATQRYSSAGESGDIGEAPTTAYYTSHPSANIVRIARGGGSADQTQTSSAARGLGSTEQTQTSSTAPMADISSAAGGFGIDDGPGTYSTSDAKGESSSAGATRNITSTGGAGGGNLSSGSENRLAGGGMGFPAGTNQTIRHETNPDGSVTYYTTYSYTSRAHSPGQ